jgi:hypothetical protein
MVAGIEPTFLRLNSHLGTSLLTDVGIETHTLPRPSCCMNQVVWKLGELLTSQRSCDPIFPKYVDPITLTRHHYLVRDPV